LELSTDIGSKADRFFGSEPSKGSGATCRCGHGVDNGRQTNVESAREGGVAGL
jgi:hypothetical protein